MPSVPDTTGSSPHPSVSPNGIGWQTLGPSIAFTSIALAVVALRWYTRAVLIRAVGREDFLITLSMILSIVYLGNVTAQVLVDKKDNNASPDDSAPPSGVEIKLILSGQCIYLALTHITKVSIITQYLRIFRDSTFRIVQYTCYAIFFLLLASFLLGVLWGVLLCNPVHRLWRPQAPGKCWNSLIYWTTAAGTNTGLDFLVWLLPMPVVGRLNLPRRQMICLLVLFLFGGFTCLIGITRITQVRTAAKHMEFSKSGAASVTWSCIEANTGIICASLLCIKPLILKLFPNVLSSQQPMRRNMHLPIIAAEDTGYSTWTCSTYVAADRNASSAYGDQGRPPTPGINVTVEIDAMETSRSSMTEMDKKPDTVASGDPGGKNSSWMKAWEQQSTTKRVSK